MVEMNEMVNILNYVMEKFLVLLDEIGRGMVIFDGILIVWLVVEYLVMEILFWIIFVIYYYELNEFFFILDNVVNY